MLNVFYFHFSFTVAATIFKQESEWVIVPLTCRNDEGPTVLIIKDKEGYVYGGYASQPWERHGDFYGDMKSFLFQVIPKASIFKPTGANNNIQWVSFQFLFLFWRLVCVHLFSYGSEVGLFFILSTMVVLFLILAGQY